MTIATVTEAGNDIESLECASAVEENEPNERVVDPELITKVRRMTWSCESEVEARK